MSTSITAAMRQWCRRLKDPRVCTVSRSPRSLSISASGMGSYGRPTWCMVDKLEDAGLIRFERNADGSDVARLTEFGMENAI